MDCPADSVRCCGSCGFERVFHSLAGVDRHTVHCCSELRPVFTQALAVAHAALKTGRVWLFVRVLLAPQHDNPEKQDRHHCADDANHSAIHRHLSFLAAVVIHVLRGQAPASEPRFQIPFIIGISSRMILTTTGPTVTTNNDGRMQKKIGNTSLTPSFAAFSSAICLACTRMKSEWARKL